MERTQVDRATSAFRDRLLSWLSEAGLMSETEPKEWSLLTAEVGSWTKEQTVYGSWKIEAVAVLASALGLAELPPHDVSVKPESVVEPLQFLSVRGSHEVVAGARLTDVEELYHIYNRVWQIHWRLVEHAISPRTLNLRAMTTAYDWWGQLDIPEAALSPEGDLIIDGRPLLEASPGALALCSSIAVERHHAANWVIGLADLYSEITTDT